MNTPVFDFVQRYVNFNAARLHMPGHKGQPFLGCEALDITEIQGADALYEADGILAESERNASSLFGSGRTLYGTEGSSQCIRAMVYLAVTCRREGTVPLILAGRNAHKAFVHALALSGADVQWLWPEESGSLYSCPLPPSRLDEELKHLSQPPAAVYVTSPDYLGGTADISGLAAVCWAHGVPLLVDNAHGAYLRFLEPDCHPLSLGATLCCDSAHKTLPVLTGGAYLHIARDAPAAFADGARDAMALFGSTSPSYLTLQSLDLCNRYLSEGYPEKLRQTARALEALRSELRANGWIVEKSDPLRLTLRVDGFAMAERLRLGGVEPEHADRDYAVLMVTPENTEEGLQRIAKAMGRTDLPVRDPVRQAPIPPTIVCSVREAMLSPQKTIPVEAAESRICGAPTVSCPPAIPIVVPGERIGPQEIALLRQHGMENVRVIR